MTSTANWYHAARPRTLPAAMAPVVLGSAISFWESNFNFLFALLAMIVALALQIGVNYANDYSDGIRGTDEVRIGPVRLVGQGLASAKAVKQAAFLSFAIAMVAGLLLTVLSGYWIFIPIGALAILSAWFYTGGKNPYGYMGLGEVFVFIWFGLAAVLGTVYAQLGFITPLAWLMAIGSGAFACAMLMVNNLRDIPSDQEVGKNTLAVRLGDSRSRIVYAALVLTGPTISGFIVLMHFLFSNTDWPLGAALGFVAAFVAHRPGQAVLKGAKAAQLIQVLAGTGKAQLTWAGLSSLGLLIQKLI